MPINNYFELAKVLWELFLYDNFSKLQDPQHAKNRLLSVFSGLQQLSLNLFPLVREGSARKIITSNESTAKKNFIEREQILSLPPNLP